MLGRTKVQKKVVCARFQFRDRHFTFNKRSKSDLMYEVSGLTSREEIQAAYIEQVSKNISAKSDVTTTNCNDMVESLISSLKNAAAKVLGVKRSDKPRDFCNDNQVVQMSDKRQSTQTTSKITSIKCIR